MRCHACGKVVAAVDRFCTGCGAALHDAGASESRSNEPGPNVDGDDNNNNDNATDDTDDTAELANEPTPTQQTPVEPAATQQLATQQLDTAALPSPTPSIGGVEPGDVEPGWDDIDPVWAPTGSIAAVPDNTPAPEPVAPLPIVPARPPAPAPMVQSTSVMPSAHPARTAEIPVLPTPLPERRGFRLTTVTVLSVVGSIAMMAAMFATLVSVSSDIRLTVTDDTPVGFRVGSWIPSDLADNLPIAGLIAVALLMCGGVAAGFGWRGGSGLAAGAGLAICGLAALTIGLAQIPIDAAHQMAAIPSDEQFTLTITRELGYYLQVSAAAIGIVVFFASLNDAFGDRRRGLNPWIAALGALAGVVMAAGPLIPEGRAVFSDNWYVVEAPGEPSAMLLSARLLQLALLALTSVIGFLAVRRWGLGVAVGGALSSLWLTASTLLELTDRPIGPGFRNPGATTMSVHGVTIIGASALAGFALLALVAAFDQAQHER